MEWLSDALARMPWYGWVVVVAILSSAMTTIVKSHHRHQERMAMIKKGLDPGRVKTSD